MHRVPHSTPPLEAERERTQGREKENRKAILKGEMEKDIYTYIYIYVDIWRLDRQIWQESEGG